MMCLAMPRRVKLVHELVMIFLSLLSGCLHGFFVFFNLLLLKILLTVIEYTHTSLKYNVEFVTIISLCKYKVTLRHEFVLKFTTNLRQVLILYLSLLEEMVFFDVRYQVIKILVVSSLRVLFEDLYDIL